MKTLKLLSGPMRLPFVILAPACAAVGIGTAYWQTGQLDWIQVILVMISAIAAHLSVNIFNEYFDFKSGLDALTRRTPFSGGSGTLQAHPELANATLAMAWGFLLLAAVIGAYFTWLRGWPLLPVGILGLLLLVTYTTWWVYQPLLCLAAPGLGFGVLMVMGAHFALTGSYTWTAFVASLVPTFLVSNLLLLNQFPDVEADQIIGRKHFPITIGRQASSAIYGAFLLLAYLAIIAGVILKLLPLAGLLALLTAILSWRAYQIARQNAENLPALAPAMGMNVLVNLVTPLLLAIGLFIG